MENLYSVLSYYLCERLSYMYYIVLYQTKTMYYFLILISVHVLFVEYMFTCTTTCKSPAGGIACRYSNHPCPPCTRPALTPFLLWHRVWARLWSLPSGLLYSSEHAWAPRAPTDRPGGQDGGGKMASYSQSPEGNLLCASLATSTWSLQLMSSTM